MNVSELYRELKMTKEEFFPLVQELGFDIGERAIKIDDRVALKIISAIKQRRNQAQKKSIFGVTATVDAQPVAPATREIALPDKISVKDFAEKLHKGVPELIAVLMRNGIMATINQTLDYETAAIIAEDMGYQPKLSLAEQVSTPTETRHNIIAEILAQEDQASLQPRPPVIVVMGHVDHGKTKLLDAIRKTNVVDAEAGGITQHIGAYQVEKKGKILTFIDTPGHEAFSAMRSRGARVADLAILVVAADDGVKPQTMEAIHILQEAKLLFVVAINKIDKPEADVERVKKELSELNLIPEDYGGKTVCVPISAKAGKNIDELLETLLLVAEIERAAMLANPVRAAMGTIIESHVDKHKGPVATVLIQNGTLRIGDIVQIGNVAGRVRAMKDWQGRDLTTAAPSTPVQVLGLKSAAIVGDVLQVVKDKKVLKQKIKAYDSFSFLRRTDRDETEKNKLGIILRADKLGSLEALMASLQGIKHAEVGIEIVQKGLGSVTENDILLAQSTHAVIYGFNSAILPGAEKLAQENNVPVKRFDIIYDLLDTAKKDLEGLLSKKVSYTKIGLLRLLAIFRTTAKAAIVGGRVEDGKLIKDAPVKILRNNKMLGEGVIKQLQQEKKNVSEVKTGVECGVMLETETTTLQPGDYLEAYTGEERARKLSE